MGRQVIGFVGTGIMGGPMARNLLRAGYRVRAYNRTRCKAEALVSDGAEVVDSAGEAADGAEVVISIVPDSPDVEQVYLGAGGVCQTIAGGAVAIDMSTISPGVARRVASAVQAKGAMMLDAPVSGGEVGARQGALSIMVGGPAEALERVRAVLEVLGSRVVHCGPSGAGQMTKLCNQVICVLNLLGVAEAVVLGQKGGLDVERMLEAVTGGSARSVLLERMGPKMIAGDYEPGFMIDLQQKDLRLVLEAAGQLQVALPGASLVRQLFSANQAAGEGRQGTQALVKTLRRLAGLEPGG